MTTKTVPTPAALRAIRAIRNENQGRVMSGAELLQPEEMAAILDRETGLADMQEALRRVWDSRFEPDKWSLEVSKALEKATGVAHPFRTAKEEIAWRAR